jgi:lysyl-tRNA synthetase class 2
MDEKDDQTAQRIKKLEALRASGIEPYGARFEGKTSLAQIAQKHEPATKEELEQSPVSYKIAGRIVSLRRFGKAAFSHLQDETGRLQVYFKQDLLGEAGYALFEKLDIGAYISAEGPLFRTKTNELTLQPSRISILSKSLRPLPEKWHGLTDVELRYRMRYVDLISNPEVRKVFIQRGRIIEAIRRFLSGHGFLEVETPMMHPIPGGAAARPFITHHNTLGVDLYLRIAPELYLKRLIVGGFERVFEINRNFRNEGISTIHNPEFTMLEFYMAYADYRDLMSFTEQLFTTVAQEVLGGLAFEYQEKKIDLTPPWKRLSYIDAIAERHGVSSSDLADPEKALDLARRLQIHVKEKSSTAKILNEIFETTVEPELTGPVFITDYPTEISPLAKRRPDAPHLTERFELYIASREIANAFSELNDPQDQRGRFEAQVAQRAAGDLEAHQMDEDYLRALE